MKKQEPVIVTALAVTKHMIRRVVNMGGAPSKLLVHPMDRHHLWKGFETIEGIPLESDSQVRRGQVVAVDNNFRKRAET